VAENVLGSICLHGAIKSPGLKTKSLLPCSCSYLK
jgi:hypothetical protein